KVEATARLQLAAAEQPVEVDDQRLAAVAAALDTIRAQVIDCRPPDATRLLQFPGVQREVKPDTEALQAAALEALDGALVELCEMREAEGARLARLLTERATTIGKHIEAARERAPEVRREQEEKLRARLAELDVEVDP